MNFDLSPELQSLRLKVRQFVDEMILPLEADPANFDAHENLDIVVLERIRDQVKAAGLWAPQLPREYGGMGLDTVSMAVLYRGNGAIHIRPGVLQLRGAG